MKQKLFDLLYGFLIGLIVTIPGFSIGTLAIILNIYERLINDFSDIVKHPLQIIKKDFMLMIGFAIGFILDIILVSYLLEHCPLETSCFFVGLVISSLIPIFKNGINSKINKTKGYFFEILTAVLCLIVLIIVTLLNAGMSKTVELSFGFIFAMLLCGVVGAGFMIIPGISGSLIVLSLGYYDSIINSLKGIGTCITSGDYNSFSLYLVPTISFAIGAVVGLILISKIVKVLLEKVPSILYFAIFGLLIGSPFAIIYLTISDYNINWSNAWMYIICPILIICGYVFGYFANKLESIHKDNKNEEK